MSSLKHTKHLLFANTFMKATIYEPLKPKPNDGPKWQLLLDLPDLLLLP
jgi:hypothetical protein